MKIRKKIIIWTLTALILQQSIFLYLENVYCSTDINTKAEKVENKDQSVNEKMEIELKAGVDNIQVSSDGRFVAYLDEGKLKVLDSSDNSIKEFQNIYNQEEKYTGEDDVTESSDNDTKKSSTNKESTTKTKKSDSSTNGQSQKEATTKKDNQSQNNSENTKVNENASKSQDNSVKENSGNEEDKDSSNVQQQHEGVGPWLEETPSQSQQQTPSSGPGSIGGPGSSQVGPWNDNEKQVKPSVSPSSDSITEKNTNITENTGITNIINYKPVLLANTNKLLINLKNSTLLAENNSEKTIDAEIVSYKWLPNESNMIVIRKIKENGSYYFEPMSFEARKGTVRELTDFDYNKMRIKLQDSDDTVDDIAFSTSTNSLYIKIKQSDGTSNLYYFNIMNQLEKVRGNAQIGKVVVPTTNAKAIFEEGSEIKIRDGANISIPNAVNPKILGVDSNDNVYFGQMVDNKINKIYYTVLSDKERQWNEINVSVPTSRDDIFIDYSGKIYINNESKKTVLELTTNKSIEYDGEFLQTYSKGVIIKSGDKLIKKSIEE